MSARVRVYSTGTCPICEKTKALLGRWGVAYEEVRVDQDRAGLKEMLEISNHARAGEESRHNLVYWEYADYIGNISF